MAKGAIIPLSRPYFVAVIVVGGVIVGLVTTTITFFIYKWRYKRIRRRNPTQNPQQHEDIELGNMKTVRYIPTPPSSRKEKQKRERKDEDFVTTPRKPIIRNASQVSVNGSGGPYMSGGRTGWGTRIHEREGMDPYFNSLDRDTTGNGNEDTRWSHPSSTRVMSGDGWRHGAKGGESRALDDVHGLEDVDLGGGGGQGVFGTGWRNEDQARKERDRKSRESSRHEAMMKLEGKWPGYESGTSQAAGKSIEISRGHGGKGGGNGWFTWLKG